MIGWSIHFRVVDVTNDTEIQKIIMEIMSELLEPKNTNVIIGGYLNLHTVLIELKNKFINYNIVGMEKWEDGVHLTVELKFKGEHVYDAQMIHELLSEARRYINKNYLTVTLIDEIYHIRYVK